MTATPRAPLAKERSKPRQRNTSTTVATLRSPGLAPRSSCPPNIDCARRISNAAIRHHTSGPPRDPCATRRKA
eukprot:3247257-Lingulodinium_polyedra.AAC.1